MPEILDQTVVAGNAGVSHSREPPANTGKEAERQKQVYLGVFSLLVFGILHSTDISNNDAVVFVITCLYHYQSKW